MKKILMTLVFASLVGGVAQAAGAWTRVSFGFSYGQPYRYRPAYFCSYPVAYTPRYHYRRFHRPHYSRAYYRHRPHGRLVARSCY